MGAEAFFLRKQPGRRRAYVQAAQQGHEKEQEEEKVEAVVGRPVADAAAAPAEQFRFWIWLELQDGVRLQQRRVAWFGPGQSVLACPVRRKASLEAADQRLRGLHAREKGINGKM